MWEEKSQKKNQLAFAKQVGIKVCLMKITDSLLWECNIKFGLISHRTCILRQPVLQKGPITEENQSVVTRQRRTDVDPMKTEDSLLYGHITKFKCLSHRIWDIKGSHDTFMF